MRPGADCSMSSMPDPRIIEAMAVDMARFHRGGMPWRDIAGKLLDEIPELAEAMSALEEKRARERAMRG